MIAFNKPYFTGKELKYIKESLKYGHISGNGEFTHRCHDFFEKHYGFKKCFLTTSCTDALEMASILVDIKPGDEVIAPSYTFVSSINPFALRGANIVFVDSSTESPNIDIDKIEASITEKTKAIIVVHYAGVAVDMDRIMSIANSHNLLVIEDAAHSIDAKYKDRPLGGIGHLGAFSFHDTKNIIAGEGGLLCINDERLVKRAEVIWEKGTNRAAFFRGEVSEYRWVDLGSSFLPSELTAAFLFAQLEKLEAIQKKRKKLWNIYHRVLKKTAKLGHFHLPAMPDYASHNAHIFYVVCKNPEERAELIRYLKDVGIHTAFHYLPLHKSPYYLDKYQGAELPNTDRYGNCLLRLPLYYQLTGAEVKTVCDKIIEFYEKPGLLQL
jgi:dTDP-4-amino-4,6-dideoxygalactose transaminase